MCHLAQCVFSLLPASTGLESKFSITDLIYTDRRSSLKPQQLENIAFLKLNRIDP